MNTSDIIIIITTLVTGIVAIITAIKKGEGKANEIMEKVSIIHDLANGNLAKATTALAAANETILTLTLEITRLKAKDARKN